MTEFKRILSAEFSPFGTFSDDQLALLERHYSLMIHWNEKLNLTRIVSLHEAVVYHYCESLYLARSLPARPLKVVDIGSGAGFPGIPLAIFRPDCAVHLVESHRRKAVFLGEAARYLPLSNVQVIAERAEDVMGRFDWLVSRAVRADAVLKLDLAPHVSILGTEGDKLPWGEDRALFHVERNPPPP